MIVSGIKVVAPEPIVTNHTMISFTDFSTDLVQSVQDIKDAGSNRIWAYCDYYEGDYIEWMADLMDAAQTVGIKVTPGAHGANKGQKDIDLILATKDHPAIFKISGKPVYTYYQFRKDLYEETLDLLTANNLQRSDYKLLVNALYAYEIEYPLANPNTGNNLLEDFRDGLGSPYDIEYDDYTQRYYYYNDSVVIEYYSASPHKVDNGIDFMLDNYGIDGLVNFGVDKILSATINENNWVSAACKAKGKLFIGGYNMFYASVSFQDHGFEGTASIWQSVIDMPVSDRPSGMSETTANDHVELSYMSPLMNPVVDGLAYIPDISEGFTLGTNTRFVLTDHSGINKFLRPFINAYKTNSETVSFGEEKIFVWYWLHPLDAPFIPTIPAEVSALGAQFTQGYWDTTVYAAANHNVPGIKFQLADSINKIRMAAHLTSPGYLKINNTLSTLKSAGPAYFEIAQALGTVTCSIIAADGVTVRKTGVGPQPITNSIYPGAFNPMIVEL
jgi:hypothetical protein